MPNPIMREGTLKQRHRKALEFMMRIRDAFYDKDGEVHERTWNELLEITGLRRKTLWKYVEKLKTMDVVRHIPAHYKITKAPITIKGKEPEGYFFYWGDEYGGVPKYERGVLKGRKIKGGGKGTYFVAIKRSVEETRKGKDQRRGKTNNDCSST